MKLREEWNQIYDDYATSRELSPSNAADWVEQRDCNVTTAMTLEAIMEILQGDVSAALNSKQVPNEIWWQAMIKGYQHGDSLTVVDGRYGYAVVDTEKQIITNVSIRTQRVTETSRAVVVANVATTVDDVKTKLTNDQLTGLQAYVKKMHPSGVSYAIFSRDADEVEVLAELKFDGAYAKAEIQEAVDAVYAAFRDSFPFVAPIFYKSELIAQLKSIPGVVSVASLVINLTLDNGTTTVNNLAEEQELPAGFFNYKNTSNTVLTAI